mmetsp:Transcript_15145/g.22333  ORF Transcript_15145/g.22333 Transcript_15145/m.22333 type:complete len:111 (+) Transcript_15145:238-570(+)
MTISTYMDNLAEREENAYNNGSDDAVLNSMAVEYECLGIVAWSSALFVTLCFAYWYYCQARKQRDRLKLMDEQEAAQNKEPQTGTTASSGGGGNYANPQLVMPSVQLCRV